jgi:hypothetical protein
MTGNFKRMQSSLEKQVKSANRLTQADAEQARDLFEKVTAKAAALRETAKSNLTKLVELQTLTETLEKEVDQREAPLEAALDRLEAQPMPGSSNALANQKAANERMKAQSALMALTPAKTELTVDRIHLEVSGYCMEKFLLVDRGFVDLLNKKEYELHKKEWLRRLEELGPHAAAIAADVATMSPFPSIAVVLADLAKDTQAEAQRIEKEEVEWRDVVVWLLEHWQEANEAFDVMFATTEIQSDLRLKSAGKDLERVRKISTT